MTVEVLNGAGLMVAGARMKQRRGMQGNDR